MKDVSQGCKYLSDFYKKSKSVFFGRCIDFPGQNFVRIKAENSDINHFR